MIEHRRHGDGEGGSATGPSSRSDSGVMVSSPAERSPTHVSPDRWRANAQGGVCSGAAAPIRRRPSTAVNPGRPRNTWCKSGFRLPVKRRDRAEPEPPPGSLGRGAKLGTVETPKSGFATTTHSAAWLASWICTSIPPVPARIEIRQRRRKRWRAEASSLRPLELLVQSSHVSGCDSLAEGCFAVGWPRQ